MQVTSADAQWMRRALETGTVSAVLWRAVRDAAGDVTDLEVADASPGFERWVGRGSGAALGERYSLLLPSGMADRLPILIDAMASGEPGAILFHPVDRAGTVRVPSAELRYIPCGPDLVYAQVFDVTAREQRFEDADAARLEAEADLHRIEAAVNASPEAFAVYQLLRDGYGNAGEVRVLFVNEAAALPTGRSSEGWRGADLMDFYPEAQRNGLIDRIRCVLDERKPQERIVSADSVRGWHGTYENLLTPFGPDFVLSTWRRVPASTVAAPAATRQSVLDDLTSVLTRGAFQVQLDEQLARLDPAGTASGVLLVIDIDDFGALNDLLGHHRADTLLAELAAGLGSMTPRPVLLGRTGPDEFALRLPLLEDAPQVHSYFARIATLLAQLAKAHGVARLHASAGFAHMRAGTTAFELLRECDTALRASIAQGGARVTGYTRELREELNRRTRISADILRGLNDDEFRLAYQPIVDLATGLPWGAESLVRWQHGDLGLLMPSEFITAAEASGLIVELGDWVLHSALAHLAVNPDLPCVTVNVSSRQVLHDDLPNVVARGLERHGVSPGRLVIEITESALLPDSGRVRTQMRDLRKLGVRVALDDFGSGYSSIGYLDRLPVDVVKLDAFFLDGELTERRRALIASTAALVHALGAVSLIEHVETVEQLELAREAGVQLGQGYLFGCPEIPACDTADA